MKRLSQPSPLATSTPTRQPSRGAWSGRWGEEARLFWVLRIASSSFSLRRQLRRRRALTAWEREPEKRRPAAGGPGAGDAGAAGGTCGSSWRRRALRRRQRGPQQSRQPQPLRPGQPPPRSPLLMRLPAPGPAAPGECGSSASRQLFADCSCFKVRRRSGQPSGRDRTPRVPAGRSASAGRSPPRPCCAGVARREFGGGEWCPGALDGKVPKSCAAGGGGSGGLVGLGLQVPGLRGRKKKLGWRGGKVRAVQGLGEGAGATVREPAKLSGVASNPW